MLLPEGYISNFTCATYYFLYVEFSDFHINQSLAGQIIPVTTIFELLPLAPPLDGRENCTRLCIGGRFFFLTKH
jgi:hypothetical protein